MSSFPTPRRGEIWLVDFSPQRGAEQGGQRPALVIQNDFGNQSPRYPNTIVLAMSTKGREIPFHVPKRRRNAPGSLRRRDWPNR